MSNELSINLPTITYVKSPFNENLQPFLANPTPGVLQVSVNGTQIVHGFVTLSTADAVLNKGNVSTIGWILFKSGVAIGNIQIGSDGTLYPLILKPGEGFICRWNAAAVHAKASSGTPQLEYWMVED
jgi:hypothetical protein